MRIMRIQSPRKALCRSSSLVLKKPGQGDDSSMGGQAVSRLIPGNTLVIKGPLKGLLQILQRLDKEVDNLPKISFAYCCLTFNKIFFCKFLAQFIISG